MTRQALLIEIGAGALPVLVPVPQVYGAWAPALYQFPAVPVPGAFAAAGLVDAVLVSWNAVARASYAIERAVDVAGAPGAWVEYTRTDSLSYAVPVAGGTIYWWRVRAIVFGRYSAYTAQIKKAPTDGSASIAGLQAQLDNIASDNLLTPGEKPTVIRDRDVIVAEQAGLDAQATAYAIAAEKTAYDDAVAALVAYLATLTAPVLWSSLAGNTTIVGATFRQKFADVYTTKQALVNAIVAAAKAKADAAQADATNAKNKTDAGLDADGKIKTGVNDLDRLVDGATYGRPLKSRLNLGKPWIDFGESIHTGKNVDNLADGTTYGRVKVGALTSGNVDLAKSGVVGRTLDNISDTVTYRRVGAGYADSSGRVFKLLHGTLGAIDGTQIIDNASAGKGASDDLTATPQFDRTNKRVTGFYGQGALATKGSVDFATAEVTNKASTNLSDTANLARGGDNITRFIGRNLDNIDPSATWAKVGAGYADSSGRVFRVYDANIGSYREGTDIGSGVSRAIAGLSGSGDVNRDVPPAKVKYTGGSTLDSLKPAEAGAGKPPGGGNLLPNSEFVTLDGWVANDNTTGVTPTVVANDGNLGDANRYLPAGKRGLLMYMSGATPAAGTVCRYATPPMSIDNLKRYIASCRVNTFRCQGRVYIFYRDSSGAWVDATPGNLPPAPAITASSPPPLSAYPLTAAGAAYDVPASAATAEFVFEMYCTGGTSPYAWFFDPYFEQASAAQTDPSPWSASTVGVEPKATKANKLTEAGSGIKTGDQRNLPNSLTTAFGAVRSTAALSANSAGTVTVNSHVVTRGPVTTTYNANASAVTGLTQGTEYYIYTRDNNVGGSPTWLATTSYQVANSFDDAYVAGAVTIPTSGTSGGGEPMCVGENTWVLRYVDGCAKPTPARFVRVGDYLLLTDGRWGRVSYAERALVEMVAVDFLEGDGLDCSLTAPLELEDGTFLLAPDVDERRLRGLDLNPLVCGVRPLGLGWVMHFTCENASFFASRDGVRFVGHHNIKK